MGRRWQLILQKDFLWDVMENTLKNEYKSFRNNYLQTII